MVQLDETPVTEKLKIIQTKLNSSHPEEATEMMTKLADKNEMEKLFVDPSKLGGEVLVVLNSCCKTVNQSFKRVIATALSQKQFAE